jgi:FKBP-type peptidyl-prolyl cis-trans isomerase FklB
MNASTLITMALLTATTALAWAADEVKLDDETARINYSVGHQIGSDFKRQGVAVNPQALVKGLEDAISDGTPLLSPEEMRTTLVELKRKIVAEQKAKLAESALKKVAEGKKFMEENAKQPGVVTTESGLQYRVLAEGTGKVPAATDQVTVNYRGTLLNGQEFDSSYSRGKPATFALNGVIKGWTEGLQHVKEGGKIKLFVPPELAYGKRGPMANQTLIFDVEVLSVGSTGQVDMPPEGQSKAGH